MLNTVLAAAGRAAGTAVVAPRAALADTGYQFVNLNPGQINYCARGNVTADSTARGEGTVGSGPPGPLQLRHRSPYAQTISNTYGPAAASPPRPAPTSTLCLPRQFQTCAINQSLQPSYVRPWAMGSRTSRPRDPTVTQA